MAAHTLSLSPTPREVSMFGTNVVTTVASNCHESESGTETVVPNELVQLSSCLRFNYC